MTGSNFHVSLEFAFFREAYLFVSVIVINDVALKLDQAMATRRLTEIPNPNNYMNEAIQPFWGLESCFVDHDVGSKLSLGRFSQKSNLYFASFP